MHARTRLRPLPRRYVATAAAAVLAAAGIVVVTGPQQPAQAGVLSSAVISDANFITDAVVPNGTAQGAIAQYPDATLSRIDPYLGNFAALGLAQAYGFTGNTAYSTAAKNYLTWYLSKLDSSNYYVVHPYTLTKPSGTYIAAVDTTHDVDSYPAYAGTFAIALRAWYRATGDLAGLKTLVGYTSNNAPNLVNAMKPLTDSALYNSTYLLARSLPTTSSYLTLDNTEAYAGIRAAQELYLDLGATSDATAANTLASNLKTGLVTGCGGSCPGLSGRNAQGLLNPSTGYFANGRGSSGVIGNDASTSPYYFFPDGAQQLWPIAVGNVISADYPLLTSAQASTAAGYVSNNFPLWSQPDSSTLTLNPSFGGGGPYYQDTLMSLGFLGVGNIPLWHSGIDRIRKEALSVNRAWPYSSGYAGMTVTSLLGAQPNLEDAQK